VYLQASFVSIIESVKTFCVPDRGHLKIFDFDIGVVESILRWDISTLLRGRLKA